MCGVGGAAICLTFIQIFIKITYLNHLFYQYYIISKNGKALM